MKTHRLRGIVALPASASRGSSSTGGRKKRKTGGHAGVAVPLAGKRRNRAMASFKLGSSRRRRRTFMVRNDTHASNTNDASVAVGADGGLISPTGAKDHDQGQDQA